MQAWEDRLGLVDEILPEWMRKKKISETTPNECYDFLVLENIYPKNSNQSKAKAFRDDLRKFQKTKKQSCELGNLIIKHKNRFSKWRLILKNSFVNKTNLDSGNKNSIKSFEEEDDLDRKKIAEKFSSIIFSKSIQNKDHDGLVVALDSAWGTGKSYFISKWMNMLGEEYKECKIKSVCYNAWENDDYDNALIPIISEIYKSTPFKERKDIAGKTAKAIVTTLGVATRQIIRNKTGIDTEEIAKEIKDAIENSIFIDYKEHQKSKTEFKKELAKLPKGEKIVVFIDELDRCRPQFAIETLEAIKHYMNVDNFVFIFAIDMEQLSHSVATLYGQNMDASGYLARFFDIQFRLPTPKISKYIKLLTKDLGEYNQDEICKIIERIFIPLKLSLRDVNHILDNLCIFLNIYNIDENFFDKVEIYVFLISLKYKYPEILKTLFHHKYKKADVFPNHTIDLIGENSISISEAIDSFLVAYRQGYLHKTIEHIGRINDNVFDRYIVIDNDFNRFSFDNMRNGEQLERVFEYIERKLEFIDYIKE